MNLAQEAWSILTIALSETAEIEVTTCVDGWDLDCEQKSPSAIGLYTQIDFCDRTVEHEIDCKLIDNPAYRELQRWHIEQIRRRQDSFIKNLASLSAMRQILLGRNCS